MYEQPISQALRRLPPPVLTCWSYSVICRAVQICHSIAASAAPDAGPWPELLPAVVYTAQVTMLFVSLFPQICLFVPALPNLLDKAILLSKHADVHLHVLKIESPPLAVPPHRVAFVMIPSTPLYQSAEQNKKTLAFFLLGAMAETSLKSLSGQASSLMQVRYWNHSYGVEILRFKTSLNVVGTPRLLHKLLCPHGILILHSLSQDLRNFSRVV